MRVVVTYTDDFGTLETVISDPTAQVPYVNQPGTVAIDDTTPTETLTLNALVTDPDGLATAVFAYQWQSFTGGVWTDIAGATGSSFTPTQAQVNQQLRVMVSYTDDAAGPEALISDATIVTGDFLAGTNAGNSLNGTEGQDIAFGNGGGDTLNGFGAGRPTRRRQWRRHAERRRRQRPALGRCGRRHDQCRRRRRHDPVHDRSGRRHVERRRGQRHAGDQRHRRQQHPERPLQRRRARQYREHRRSTTSKS